MKINTIISKSEAETKGLGTKTLVLNMNALKKGALIIALNGELGAGKTVFVKGIGDYLGVTDIVSPTFVISCEYDINREPIGYFYHFDLYRLENEIELNDIGLVKAIVPGNIICIEWEEKSKEFIHKLESKARIIDIKIDHIDKNKRKITIINN